MDIGLIINPLHAAGPRPPELFDEVIERIRLADEWGYSSVWITEHHFLRYSRPSSMVTLAAAAKVTERIRLSTAVAVLPFHHPIRLAEDLATLDQISHGRLNVGIARGLFPAEFDGFCVPFEESRPRFLEGRDLLLLAWTSDEPFSFEGEFHRVENVIVYPRPYQQPHPPLYQAVVSPGSFEPAVEQGFNGLVGAYLTPFEVVKETAYDPWNAARERLGRMDLRNAHNEIVHVAESREAAYREAEEPVMEYVRAAGEIWGSPDNPNWSEAFRETWASQIRFLQTVEWDEVFENLVIVGDPDYVTERLRLHQDAGVDELLVYPCDLDFETTSRSLKLLADEVMPRLKAPVAAQG